MKPKPFSRIYFPGLISLVFLPLMCIGYFAYKGRLERLAMLDVFWTSDNYYKPGYVYKDKAFDIHAYRKLKNIQIGSYHTDTSLLKKINDKVERLITTKDTVNGYCVVLTDKATYGDLVGLLDIFDRYKDNGIIALPYKDSIFIVHKIYKIYQGPMFECGLIRPSLPKPTLFENMIKSVLVFKKDVLLSAKSLLSFWPSLIALVLMIFFSLKIKKVNAVNN